MPRITSVFVAVIALCLASPVLANPKQAGVHSRQATAYFNAKQYEQAIEEFKKAFALDPKPLTLFKIASAYYQKADYAGAIDYYGKYLQADPDGPMAAQALEFTTVANKALADAKKEREAAEATAKEAEEARRREKAAEQQRLAATGHVKNAEAFAGAGAWRSAGDEHRAAFDADGDPAHLFDAGEAYRKHPDHEKARDAYRAYLDRLPVGPRSDDARKALAATTRAIDEASREAQEREAKRIATATSAPAIDRPSSPVAVERGWARLGARVSTGAAGGNQNPLKMFSSEGLVLGPSVQVGAFARYDISRWLALRPELAFFYQSFAFDTNMMNDAVQITRAGAGASIPLVIYFNRGTVSAQLAVGPVLAVMPQFEATIRDPMIPPIQDPAQLDPGFLAAFLVDIGSYVTLEVRFNKFLGQLADNFDCKVDTYMFALSIGFGLSK